MPFTLSPLLATDIPAFATLDTAAGATWPLAQAMHASNPSSSTESRTEMVERWTRASFAHPKPGEEWMKCVDSATGEMVAVALWGFEFEGGRGEKFGQEGVKTEEVGMGGEAVEEWPSIFAVMGANWASFHADFVGDSPFANLKILLTHPRHQRRGAASQLVSWGCARADAHNLMTVLTASEAATKLYLNHGFKIVRETVLDLRPYGVQDVEVRRGMVREARGGS